MVFEKYKPLGFFSEFYSNLRVFRRTQSESDIFITTKGFGVSIYPQGPVGIAACLDYYKACGNWEIRDL